MTPAESENVSEMGPDTQTLKNHAKSRAYYQRNRERILHQSAAKYHLWNRLPPSPQLRRTGRLEQQFESLLGRRMHSEIKEDNHDLNEVTAYDCSKAQYVECIYREFCFMFRRDGIYDNNHDSVFKAQVDEMDTLNNEVACCTDAILNLDGYGAHYEKANTLAVAVTTVGGWVADDEPLGSVHSEFRKYSS
ncbi:hypothetical protein IW262DRAFT_1295697 [Armillaria fumosa]|nr:hypothetical protein IW262DRAFT_1295697 [Armillaria fumosa]